MRRNGSVAAWMVVLAATMVLPATSAKAQCVKDTREVKFGSASARFASYLCKAGESSARVEFFRLSEAAAAGVLDGKPWPEVAKAIGNTRLVSNAVGLAATDLFSRFGKTHDREDAYYVQAFAPKIGKGTEKLSAGTGIKSFTYLSYPDTERLTGQPISLPEADAAIKSATDWPAEFKFIYGGPGADSTSCTHPGDFNCTTVWRYMVADDIRLFEERFKTQQKALGLDDPPADLPSDDGEPAAEEIGTPGAEPLRLVEYLTRDGWPADFITIVGEYSGCGGGYDFNYYPRQMVLDVAVIENASRRPLNAGELLGATTTGGLRPENKTREASKTAAASVSDPLGQLAPGARVLVPLRISFVTPEGLREKTSVPMDNARRIYSLIERSGDMIVEKNDWEAGEEVKKAARLTKSKRSFRPPEQPTLVNYAWGPEIVMNGLVADGTRVLLAEASANFLELTAGEGYGSCPYLYAFDPGTSRWVGYGKVIHQADDETKETSEEVRLEKFATRFRIAEEELELSMIDRVALVLDLKRGQTVRLPPKQPILASADKRYAQIRAGEAIEVSFELPPDVRESDVAEAKLSVTGYYRRYGGMKISRLP